MSLDCPWPECVLILEEFFCNSRILESKSPTSYTKFLDIVNHEWKHKSHLINLSSSIFRCLVAFAKVENFDWNIKNRESKTVAYKAVVTYNVKLVKILLTIKSVNWNIGMRAQRQKKFKEKNYSQDLGLSCILHCHFLTVYSYHEAGLYDLLLNPYKLSNFLTKFPTEPEVNLSHWRLCLLH